MSDNNSLPQVHPNVSLREEYDDWALLFNPDTGDTVGLTPTGVTIWKSLTEGKDMSGIMSALSQEFEDLPDNPEKDILVFFDEIVTLGFAKKI
ncbi:MAG TPA: PqqD family peptide modification chaperone [Methanospirillum sp.]|uniref:PqqD family peptide modification chaperone n=1 Tax=Methanospirillum sp. TaxID=45200 RepID=UPI002C65E112|nr:PqqD family peptide modification chaperone [Methanospirillum sp.]HWQ63305.1 PqqD family peptide modification chaperone [Methanospirillum sp.]